jgi:phage FluMu gp28-like protein
MKNSRQKAKTFKLGYWELQRSGIQHSIEAIEASDEELFQSLASDPLRFCKEILLFEPTEYQRKVVELFGKKQFMALRWCRQSGKSLTVSALLLYYALTHPKSEIAVVGPSWRQTKLNIRRMAGLLENVRGDLNFKPQRTAIHFKNGSTIEAYPNNPDTIRGPTLNIVWWDEAAFTPNDVDLYDAILFTLGTTDGKLIATSTPWNSGSIFWKMCNHKDWSDFERSHVPVEKATVPLGPLKPNMIEKIKKQFGEDPSRWRREMEAEWAEDEDVWLPQSLIVACVGTKKNCGEDLQPWNPEQGYEGDLFAGLDLAQVRDYCVFSVIQRLNDRLFLRHLKIFSQPTKYANVLGYVKMLQDRWGGFSKMRVDFTKEGPSIISDMTDAGIKNAEGVNFSVPRKSEMANLLKQRMSDQRFFYPLLTWEKPYRSDVCTELNVERYELRKDGTIALNHPMGTHDDVFWSLALGVYATVDMKPVDIEAMRFG